jgi:hypothetical protein
MSIRLSPEHGVNPSITKCFWCGKDTGIALLGMLKGDKEAPRSIIPDYEPCHECIENFSRGVLCAEVSSHPMHQGQPELQENAYPTGRHCVVKAEAFEGKYPMGTRLLIPTSVYSKMFDLEEVK